MRPLAFIIMLGLLALPLLWAFRFEIQAWRYRDVILPAASRYGVPAPLIAAVIWQETRFHPYVAGKAGELGLMQVLPASGQEWARAERVTPFNRIDLLDPGTNVLAGTWYLHRAMQRWADSRDPLPRALAEYNAGRSNALRWERALRGQDTPFASAIGYPSTQRYVSNIVLHARTYGRPWLRVSAAFPAP